MADVVITETLLLIKQGEDLVFSIALYEPVGKPVLFDIPGFLVTFRSKIRKRYSSPTALLSSNGTTFKVEPSAVAPGTVNFIISSALTASLPSGESLDDEAGQLVWDVEAVIPAGHPNAPVASYPTGRVIRLLQGRVKVSPEATY